MFFYHVHKTQQASKPCGMKNILKQEDDKKFLRPFKILFWTVGILIYNHKRSHENRCVTCQ